MLNAFFQRVLSPNCRIPRPPLVERLFFPHRFGQRLTHWHACRHPMFPMRLTNGEWSAVTDKLYRRWRADRWEFKVEPESEDDSDRRQW